MLPHHSVIRGDIYGGAAVSKVLWSCSDLGRVRESVRIFRIRPQNWAVKIQLQNISNPGSSKVQSAAICVYIKWVKLVKLCRESLSEWVLYSVHSDPGSAWGYEDICSWWKVLGFSLMSLIFGSSVSALLLYGIGLFTLLRHRDQTSFVDGVLEIPTLALE